LETFTKPSADTDESENKADKTCICEVPDAVAAARWHLINNELVEEFQREIYTNNGCDSVPQCMR